MRRSIARRTLLRSALLLAVLPLLGCAEDAPPRPTIAAAASLRHVLPALLAAHAPDTFQVSYAGSGTLRRQIEAGSPVDVALFAGAAPVDLLLEQGLGIPESRVVLATNTLVLIGSPQGADWTFATIPNLPDGERIAIGAPDAVPAGGYARAAWRKLGVWDQVRARCVYAADVSAVLTYVRRGEVRAGVVYGSELVGIDGVRTLEVAAGPWAPRPLVVGVQVVGSAHPGVAARLLSFLQTQEARAIFARFGFGAP